MIKSLVVFGACITFACKPTTPGDSGGAGGRRQFSDLYASGESETRQKGNFYYALFKRDYELKFDALPAAGVVADTKVPYSGSWYPQKTGGTSRDLGTGNVLQKYDAAFNGGQSKAQEWERDHHSVDPNSSSAGWAGHCNGFSASAQRHSEPKTSVKRGAVSFGPKDIKALLAEIHMSAKFYFLGGNRCKQDSKISLTTPGARSDSSSLDDCDDVNPASFHTAITNWIGIQKHVVIVDTFSREQVWNYPHFKYDYTSKAVETSEAMRLITGTANAAYRFNSSAVSFRSVTMNVTHSKAFENEYLAADLKASDKAENKTYQYILELDAQGKIIGGEWVGDSQQNHPDFLWVAFEPTAGDGNEFAANPNVNPKEVIKLWAESVGVDPNNPPLDLLEPVVVSTWGYFPKFELDISGNRSGTAFLGRALVLGVTRFEPLHGDFTLEIAVDGKPLEVKNLTGDAPAALPLPPLAVGVHLLSVKWKRGADYVDHQQVRFIAQ